MEGLGVNWKILLGQIINFAVLFFVLKKFVFKTFLNTLEKRKKVIEDGVKKSEEAERNLSKIRELEQNVKLAGEKNAKELIKSAELTAAKRKQDILEETEKEKTGIIFAAKEAAQREISETKEKQRAETINLSFLLAEKFLKEKMDKEKDGKLLNEIFSKIE
jgi:F-type H+-transporting ATPase subunit b